MSAHASAPKAPDEAGVGGMPLGRAELPSGRVVYAMYPRMLLRGTGFDVGPLLHPAGEAGGDYATAVDATLRTVRTAFRDTRLREAVAQTNPGYFEIAFAPGRALVTGGGHRSLTKHGRRQVRTAHRYLRRLLGKTETNAFFGPTLVATWDLSLDEPLAVGDPVPERCATGLSHWVVREFAARHRRTVPAARRAWRRDPLWRHDGGATLRCALNGREVALTEAADAVWRELREPGTPAELLERTGLAAGAVRAALTLLAPALRPWPEPPSTLIDGLGWLTREAPGDGVVARLAKLLDEAGSPWPHALQVRQDIRAEIASAGIGTARAAGRHYADRDVINEDRSSPWSGRVALGRPAAESAHRALGDVLPLFLLAALLRQSDAREAVVRHTGGAPAGLVELAAADIAPAGGRTARLHAELADLVPGDPGLAEVRLDPREVAERLRPLWESVQVADGDQLAAFPGFDLMAAGGPPGRGRWVLSECHDDSSSAIGGITSRVQPGGGSDFAAFSAVVSCWLDTGRMATVVGRRRSRHVTPELPGLSIELSGVSGKRPAQVRPAAEAQVSADATRVVCDGGPYQLYPGDVSSTLFTALSLPCLVPVPFATGRPATPRIVLGDTVVQRRRWQVAAPAGAGGFGRGEAGFRAVTEWREGLGLPDRVFLRHPDEPKPLLIDFRDPFAVDDLTRLRPARMVCTEVLPDLSDTWWRADGAQPAELRIPVFLRWERDGAAG